jgi:hypothetical protein
MPPGKKGRDSGPEIPRSEPLPASGPPPSSGSRPPASSARAPVEYVAWGAVRDALTAIHNLEVLLKSPRVGTKVLAEVLHEFLEGVAVLRGAFTKASQEAKTAATAEARKALAELTRARLDELERTMQQAMTSDFDARGRLALEQVVTRVSVDLDAAAELLDLSDRSEHATETELSLDELARVSLRGAAYGTDRQIAVRLANPAEDCVMRADPHVVKRLVAFAIARAHARGAEEVSLRVRCTADAARIEVGPTADAERSLPSTLLRLVRRIDPTDAIVDAAAAAAAVTMTTQATTITLEVPRGGQ